MHRVGESWRFTRLGQRRPYAYVELRPEAVLSASAGPTVAGSVSVDVQTLSGAGVGYHTEVSPSYPSVPIHGLPASDVVVRLSGDGITFYWYGGTSLETATRVTLRSGRTTSIVVPGP